VHWLLPLPSIFASRLEPARSSESLGFRLEASARAAGLEGRAPRRFFFVATRRYTGTLMRRCNSPIG
jgi:hypothetical protein